MPRRNRSKGSCQKSKRARIIAKDALFSGLGKNFGHPSHVSGVQRVLRSIGYRPLPTKLIKSLLKKKG